MGDRPQKWWKIALAVVGVLVVVLVVPALVPPGGRYDPGPYFLAVKQSAALPATKGADATAG